jgi:hypothetical protein
MALQLPEVASDGIRITWSWIFGIGTAILSAIIIAGFRLVWKGAMADVERRLDLIEIELKRRPNGRLK